MTDFQARERNREAQRRWRAKPENREKARERGRLYQAQRRQDPKYVASIRAYQEENRSRLRSHAKSYGLTLEEYDSLKARAFECEICGTAASENKTGKLFIDHDHNTGVVRGLLCDHCNRGLGYFKDSPGLLEAAKMYLERERS